VNVISAVLNVKHDIQFCYS